MFRLETDRLFIRPWTDDDRAAFRAIMTDVEVTRYVHGGKPFTEDDIDAFFARQARQLAESDLCMGALIEKESGAIVGIAGAQPLGDDIEIGWILSRRAWGRGYATEAGGVAMRHVLETLGRDRVVAIIDPGNDASTRVAGRLGMKYVGRRTGAELRHRKPELVVDLFVRERNEESAV